MTLLDVDLEFPNLVDVAKIGINLQNAKYFRKYFYPKFDLTTIVYIHNNYALQI